MPWWFKKKPCLTARRTLRYTPRQLPSTSPVTLGSPARSVELSPASEQAKRARVAEAHRRSRATDAPVPRSNPCLRRASRPRFSTHRSTRETERPVSAIARIRPATIPPDSATHPRWLQSTTAPLQRPAHLLQPPARLLQLRIYSVKPTAGRCNGPLAPRNEPIGSRNGPVTLIFTPKCPPNPPATAPHATA